jgi:UDP-N-acetylmuramoylalanine--D-glutamate ligase
MLESIRRQLAPSPLEHRESLTVGVLGYGEAGRAAAALLTKHGHQVRISDEGPVTLAPGMVAAGVESGGHTIEFLGVCDLVVASPGVPADRPVFANLDRRGIPVVSELELAFQISALAGEKTPLIGVTGTTGKRTTVELLQHLFRAAGRQLTIGGNRGLPLSELLLEQPVHNPIALAVSSFQLETVVHFRPDIAVLLNINEAHLDRHRSVAEYVRTKSRIFMNQRPDDALILPFDDEHLRTLARKHQGRTFFMSSRQAIDRGAWLVDGTLRMNVSGVRETVGPVESRFAENLLAAVLAARLSGLLTEQIAAALDDLRTEGDVL